MDKRVEERFAEIESRKAHLLQTLERLPAERLSQSISAKHWSPICVVEHLIMAEEAQLADIRSSKSLLDAPNKRRRGRLIQALVWVLHHRIRVPAPTEMEPTGKIPLSELKERWSKVRADFVAEIAPVDAESLVAKHAILGWITPLDMLDITNAHLDYHTPQLR